MKSVRLRFPNAQAFERLLFGGADLDLEISLPPEPKVNEGEWVLVVIELGPEGRAPSAVARVGFAPEGPKLVFEPRDWLRLSSFAEQSLSRLPRDPPAAGEQEQGGVAWAAEFMQVVCERADLRGPPSGVKGLAPKILVVDDDEDLRGLLTVLLEGGGLRVLAVESAEQALRCIETEAVSLLVLDWNLPRMTGIDLCRMLRAQMPALRIPILFLTAHAEPADVEEAFASGADDYVAKPFRAPELRARIFRLLRDTAQAFGHSA